MKERQRLCNYLHFSISFKLLTGDASVPLDFLRDAQIPEPTPIYACTILTQDGKIPPNSAVVQLLMKTASMVLQINSSQFEQMMNSAMQV